DVDHRVAEDLLVVLADVDRNPSGLEPGPGEALDLVGLGLAEGERLLLDRRRVREDQLERLVHGVEDLGPRVPGEARGEGGQEQRSRESRQPPDAPRAAAAGRPVRGSSTWPYGRPATVT